MYLILEQELGLDVLYPTLGHSVQIQIQIQKKTVHKSHLAPWDTPCRWEPGAAHSSHPLNISFVAIMVLGIILKSKQNNAIGALKISTFQPWHFALPAQRALLSPSPEPTGHLWGGQLDLQRIYKRKATSASKTTILWKPGFPGQPSRPKIPLRPGDSKGAARRSWGRRQRPDGRWREKERGTSWLVAGDEVSRTLKIWLALSREQGSRVRKLLYSERGKSQIRGILQTGSKLRFLWEDV